MTGLLNLFKFLKRGIIGISKETAFKNKFDSASINMQPFISQVDGNVELGKNVKINKGVMLRGNIKLGRGTFINGPSRIATAKNSKIEIGQFCSIGGFSALYSGNHPTDGKAATYQTGNGFYSTVFADNIGKNEDIKIGSDVWIGSHSVILSGVIIGNGVVIGAGSIVTKHIPDYAIVAGCPARIIKYRFSEELIQFFKKVEWWNWADQKILANGSFFSADLKQILITDLQNLIRD